MNIPQHNPNLPLVGTSLQGYVKASYTELVRIFGVPSDGEGYKVSTEWMLRFDDGTIATIYDYKETCLYDDGCPTVAQFRAMPSYEWHIGGHGSLAVARVLEAIAAAKPIEAKVTASHTSGPWSCRFDETGGYGCMSAAYKIEADGFPVCDVDVADYCLSPWESGYIDNMRCLPHPVAHANGALIAAAPDLLEEGAVMLTALEEIIFTWNSCQNGSDYARIASKMARIASFCLDAGNGAAIAKATVQS